MYVNEEFAPSFGVVELSGNDVSGYNHNPNQFDPAYWDIPRTGDRISGSDPAGHDNMPIMDDYQEYAFGEHARETASVLTDPNFQAAMDTFYPAWERPGG